MPLAKIPRAKRTFKVSDRSDIPTGRKGKHNKIVHDILADLEGLEGDQCLKIPLDELPDTKVNIRSALNRASHKAKQKVATAADDEFLYVWNG
jgi:hypothetical protein